MSTWTTPATFVTGAVTAASMNAEIRDHANFLKGALDLLTGSTTADTGTTMQIKVVRTLSSDAAIEATVTGDAVSRYRVRGSGQIEWSDGTAAADTIITRGSAGLLRTSDTALSGLRAAATSISLQALVSGDTTGRLNILGSGELQWGSGAAASDCIITRASAGLLRTIDTAVSVQRTVGGSIALQALTSGDPSGRLNIYASGEQRWSDGTATHDIAMSRSGASVLRVTSNAVASAQIVTRVQADVGQAAWTDCLVSGDTAARARLRGDATFQGIDMGSGTAIDTNLYRSAANVLKTDDTFNSVLGYQFNGTAVVGARVTGYTNPFTGTLNRATAYATGTVTLAQLAERVGALQADLTAHGLIGA